MKPTTVSVETVSTVSATSQVMGIDQAGMGTVLDILSNMYSDGSLAVVREYASNAFDSHIEAGNPDPILVTSPMHLNPTLTIQDFGTGLSEDEVLNVYAKYGASTKRNSDDQIGSFGIGAKSAFTVGTQFVVTAVKNGEKTVALFALNDSGAPTVNIVSHDETIEPNGVKVEIGVRDVDGVNRAIEKLFTTWKYGTVLVDGVEPPCVFDSAEKVTDDIHLTWKADRYSETETWTVVMGGVPYDIPDAVIDTLMPHPHQFAKSFQQTMTHAYLTVPIGAVDITPSREELRVTPKTSLALDELITKFSRELPSWMTRQVHDSKSLVEAINRTSALKRKLIPLSRNSLPNVTWRGMPLPGKTASLREVTHFTLRNKRRYYGEKIAGKNVGLSLVPNDTLDRHLFVTDVPERRVRSVQLAAKPFLKSQGDGGIACVVALTQAEASYAQDWFDLSDPAWKKTDFGTFIKQWKPAPGTSTPRQAPAYFVSSGTCHDGHKTVAELNQMSKLFFMTPGDQNTMSTSDPIYQRAIGLHPVACLKATQKVEVFLKRVPHAISARDAIIKESSAILGAMTPGDLDLISASNARGETPLMQFLIENHDKITNPVVLGVVSQRAKLGKLRDSNPHRLGGRLKLLRHAAAYVGRNLDREAEERFDNSDRDKVSSGLPLLDTYLNRSWDRSTLGDEHAIMYINSVTL